MPLVDLFTAQANEHRHEMAQASVGAQINLLGFTYEKSVTGEWIRSGIDGFCNFGGNNIQRGPI